MNLLEAKLGGASLYKTSYPNGHYAIWKTLPVGAFLKYQEASFSLGRLGLFELEEKVLKECLIYTSWTIPEDSWEAMGITGPQEARAAALEFLPTGVMSNLCKVILRESSPQRPFEAVWAQGMEVTQYFGAHDICVAKIAATFPGFNIDDLMKKDMNELIRLFALAMFQSGQAIMPAEQQDVRSAMQELTSPNMSGMEELAEQQRSQRMQQRRR